MNPLLSPLSKPPSEIPPPAVAKASSAAQDPSMPAVYDRIQSSQSDYAPLSPRHAANQRVYEHLPSACAADPNEYNRVLDKEPSAAPSTALPHFVPAQRLSVPGIRLSRTVTANLHRSPPEPSSKPKLLPRISFVRSASTVPASAFEMIEPLAQSSDLSAEAFRAQLQQPKLTDIQSLLKQNPSYSDYFLLEEPRFIQEGTSCKIYKLSTPISNKPSIVIKLITNLLQFSTTAIYDPDVGEHLAKDLPGFSNFRVVLPKEVYYFRKLSGSDGVSFTTEPSPCCQLAFTHMPAFSGTTLADWVDAHKMSPDLNEMAILRNAYHIARALQFLSENGLSHTDVHAKNILVENGVWYLCDFGLLQRIKPNGNLPYGFGNRLISPPERLKGSPSGLNVDAWSFGLLLYFALHRGEHLYSSPEEILAAGAEFPISDSISMNTQNLLRSALNPDQAHRHTIGDIVKELEKIPGVIPDADDDDNKD